ncbi:hypothetical protein HPB51_010677 [Rhipicephalus microplus]|uniref:Uncharacterized protein n=1 Tax=Rhipicephalus microplus TaxID=6941 RepID=A0A9J6DV91_RHIMP|nr:hypothetical protein HPB51_010677 [Rhipicephalus microplus]
MRILPSAAAWSGGNCRGCHRAQQSKPPRCQRPLGKVLKLPHCCHICSCGRRHGATVWCLRLLWGLLRCWLAPVNGVFLCLAVVQRDPMTTHEMASKYQRAATQSQSHRQQHITSQYFTQWWSPYPWQCFYIVSCRQLQNSGCRLLVSRPARRYSAFIFYFYFCYGNSIGRIC